MKLIIGLGNPGKEYEKTRHNVGFMVVDAICAGSDPAIGAWKHDKRANAEITKGEIAGQKVILAKPQTFMNNSGQSVKSLASSYKLQVIDLLIVHDDLDLPLGTLRLSHGSGSAGHNGVQSIINHLKTKEFWRLRVGIGPKKGDAAKFVLKPFSRLEQIKLKKTTACAVEVIEKIIIDNPEKVQNDLNSK